MNRQRSLRPIHPFTSQVVPSVLPRPQLPSAQFSVLPLKLSSINSILTRWGL